MREAADDGSMSTLPTNYEGSSAEEKLAWLWERIMSERYAELPPNASGVESAKLLLVPHNRKTLEHVSDELPEGRKKLIHSIGSVARVRVRVLDSHGYTGLFARDAVGLLRMSDANGGVKDPSCALKFTIDGQPSRNLFANKAVIDDNERPHPLSLPLSSSTPDPEEVTLAVAEKAFDAAAKAVEAGRWRATYQPLFLLSTLTQRGEAVERGQAPDRVDWHPSDAAREACPDKGDWRLGFAEIPVGTVLYQLRVASVPEAESVPWAELVLETPLVASRYGDQSLFFQHQFR